MLGEIQLPQLSIVVLARNHNPSILSPDFLRLNKIVDENWQVGSPIFTPRQIHKVLSQEFERDDFIKTFERLLELQESEELEEEDDEIFFATEYAFSGSIDLLIELYYLLGESFPLGYTSVDARGGVNLIWKSRQIDKEVRFNFPAYRDNLKKTVYYRLGSESHLVEEPSIIELAELLQWLRCEKSTTIFAS